MQIVLVEITVPHLPQALESQDDRLVCLIFDIQMQESFVPGIKDIFSLIPIPKEPCQPSQVKNVPKALGE